MEFSIRSQMPNISFTFLYAETYWFSLAFCCYICALSLAVHKHERYAHSTFKDDVCSSYAGAHKIIKFSFHVLGERKTKKLVAETSTDSLCGLTVDLHIPPTCMFEGSPPWKVRWLLSHENWKLIQNDVWKKPLTLTVAIVECASRYLSFIFLLLSQWNMKKKSLEEIHVMMTFGMTIDYVIYG